MKITKLLLTILLIMAFLTESVESGGMPACRQAGLPAVRQNRHTLRPMAATKADAIKTDFKLNTLIDLRGRAELVGNLQAFSLVPLWMFSIAYMMQSQPDQAMQYAKDAFAELMGTGKINIGGVEGEFDLGVFGEWEICVKAMSYLITGEVLSEDELLKRVKGADKEVGYIIKNILTAINVLVHLTKYESGGAFLYRDLWVNFGKTLKSTEEAFTGTSQEPAPKPDSQIIRDFHFTIIDRVLNVALENVVFTKASSGGSKPQQNREPVETQLSFGRMELLQVPTESLTSGHLLIPDMDLATLYKRLGVICPRIWNEASDGNRIKTYEKHGLAFQYACLVPEDYAGEELFETVFKSCGGAMPWFDNESKAFRIFISADLSPDEFIEYAAVHELGESLLNTHPHATLLEFAACAKDGKVRDYLNWLRVHRRRRFLGLFAYIEELQDLVSKGHQPIGPVRDFSGEEGDRENYLAAKSLVDGLRWPTEAVDVCRAYEAANRQVEKILDACLKKVTITAQGNAVSWRIMKECDSLVIKAIQEIVDNGLIGYLDTERVRLLCNKHVKLINTSIAEGWAYFKQYLEEDMLEKEVAAVTNNRFVGFSLHINDIIDRLSNLQAQQTQQAHGHLLPSGAVQLRIASAAASSARLQLNFQRPLPEYTDETIKALEECNGNRKRAAKSLKISRQALSQRIAFILAAAYTLGRNDIIDRLAKLERPLPEYTDETIKALEECNGNRKRAAKSLKISRQALSQRIAFILAAAYTLGRNDILIRLNNVFSSAKMAMPIKKVDISFASAA